MEISFLIADAKRRTVQGVVTILGPLHCQFLEADATSLPEQGIVPMKKIYFFPMTNISCQKASDGTKRLCLQ